MLLAILRRVETLDSNVLTFAWCSTDAAWRTVIRTWRFACLTCGHMHGA